MSILNQIGKKVSNAGKEVAQQTKAIAETTKISSMISDEEKKIVQIYTSIGQGYYNLHKADQEGDFIEDMSSITASFEKIFLWKEQIKEYKGVSKCPRCGADVPNGAQFCNNCGEKMPLDTEKNIADRMGAKKRICPQCQGIVPLNNKFCMKCGVKIETEDVQLTEET